MKESDFHPPLDDTDTDESFSMPGAPTAKKEAPPQQEIPPKIRELNEALIEMGRTQELLSEDAGEDAIARVEKIVLTWRTRRSIPFEGDAEKHAQKVREHLVHAYARSEKAPSFLKRLFSKAERAASDAADAKFKADAAVAQLAERQAKHESLVAARDVALEELKRATQVRNAFEETLAELSAPEAITRRWVDSTWKLSDTDRQAKYIDWDRTVVQAALADWPAVEKVLRDRIAAIDKEIKALEASA